MYYYVVRTMYQTKAHLSLPNLLVHRLNIIKSSPRIVVFENP